VLIFDVGPRDRGPARADEELNERGLSGGSDAQSEQLNRGGDGGQNGDREEAADYFFFFVFFFSCTMNMPGFSA
jgi:hypothetical protein